MTKQTETAKRKLIEQSNSKQGRVFSSYTHCQDVYFGGQTGWRSDSASAPL